MQKNSIQVKICFGIFVNLPKKITNFSYSKVLKDFFVELKIFKSYN